MREINKPTQSLLSAPPYNFVNFPRTGRGGDLGILYHSTITISTLKHIVTTSMELVICIITRRYHPAIKVFIIYRPPNLDLKNCISDFIEHVTPNTTQNTIILGDLNIHVNKISQASSTDFLDLLENNNLKQHIDFPTHTCGNILDKIITRTKNTIASDFEQSIIFSDHYAITFLIHSSKPSQAKKNISYRKLSSIDMDKFKGSVANSLSNSTGIYSIETLNCSLSEQLNIFASLKSLNITERYKHEWYDEECSNNRRHLRSFERKYRKSNTIKNLTSFRQLQCQHNHLLQKKRSNYNLQSITDARRDQKKLFKLANDLLGRNCKNK